MATVVSRIRAIISLTLVRHGPRSCEVEERKRLNTERGIAQGPVTDKQHIPGGRLHRERRRQNSSPCPSRVPHRREATMLAPSFVPAADAPATPVAWIVKKQATV